MTRHTCARCDWTPDLTARLTAVRAIPGALYDAGMTPLDVGTVKARIEAALGAAPTNPSSFDADLAARLAAVEALHQPVMNPEHRPGVRWCSCSDGYYEYDDCPTARALTAPAPGGAQR